MCSAKVILSEDNKSSLNALLEVAVHAKQREKESGGRQRERCAQAAQRRMRIE